MGRQGLRFKGSIICSWLTFPVDKKEFTPRLRGVYYKLDDALRLASTRVFIKKPDRVPVIEFMGILYLAEYALCFSEVSCPAPGHLTMDFRSHPALFFPIPLFPHL